MLTSMEMNPPRSNFLPLLIGGVALILFLAIMLYGLISGRSGPGNQPVPLLEIDGPLKTAPDGLHIRPEPHRDITVFDVFKNDPEPEPQTQLLEETEGPDFDSRPAEAVVSSDNDAPVTQTQPTTDSTDALIPELTLEAAETPSEDPPESPAAEPEPAAPAPPVSGDFIQLAAFADENAAHGSWQALQKKHSSLLGNQPHLVKKWHDVDNNKTFYRLLIGPFSARDQAETLCRKLQNLAQSCFVRKLPAE